MVEGTVSTQIAICEEDVCHAIRSFPRGSAGGPDGIHPQHLSDLTSASAERGGRELLSALTSFCNFVVSGLTPPFSQPIFFGATLIPLRKKDGGVRPIAVGQTLRRLVAKCVSIHVIHTVGPDLVPLQLGCGVPLGCEAAAHAARHYLRCMPLNHLLLKLDFKNAFNTLRRDRMIDAVQQSTPEMFSFIDSAYASPSHLFCGDNILQSAEGVQQGDPLGPLLFCITTQQLILNLRSEFRVFYLDDGTLGGPVDVALSDLHQIEKGAAELGLQLNRKKCEVICDDESTCNAMLSAVPGLQVVGCSQATFLGSPIGDSSSIDECIHDKTMKLELMGERLHLLSSHDSLLLLRHSAFLRFCMCCGLHLVSSPTIFVFLMILSVPSSVTF